MAIANRKINTDSAKIIMDNLTAKKQIAFISEQTGENMAEILSRLIETEFKTVGGEK